MRYFLLLFFLTFFSVFSSFSQTENEFEVKKIDSILKVDANAIVRKDFMNINLLAVDKAVVKKRYAVTVLNKKGENYISLSEGYSPETKIKRLEAFIYNEKGDLIKKIKKNDFTDKAYNTGYLTVASDGRYKYYNLMLNEYPYTVDFHVEYETLNTGFLSSFYFNGRYKQGVEESEIVFQNPSKIPYWINEQNFEGYSIKKDSTNTNISYKATKIKPVKSEKRSPPSSKIFPHVKFSLQKFNLVDVQGEVQDWKSMGTWQNENLLKGRRELPAETIQEVSKMLEGVTDDIEKAKIIYKYVQDKTRYVSIQLGIGGWKPMKAEDVDRLGYGDCKGLTNYTKALLDSQNIPSYYSIIYGDRNIRNINKDIVSLQGNHVILNLPNNGKDIWLECTSQTSPFGYIAGFTDNRNTLVVTPEGGIIKKTKEYKAKDNEIITTVKVDFFDTNTLKGKLKRTSKGICYSWSRGVENEKDKKQYYKDEFDHINNLAVSNSEYKNDLDNAIFNEDLEFLIKSYASKAGSKFVLKPNVFVSTYKRKLKTENRTLPIVIQRGATFVDSYEISIPAYFGCSKLPEPKKITSVFGEYLLSISKISDNKLQLERKLVVNSGEFSKDKVEEYNSFYKSIRRADNIKLILQKNNK